MGHVKKRDSLYLKKRFNKKGQITMFILIGLVILAIVSLAFFFVSRAKQPIDLEPTDVPAEFVPIRNYVEDCLYETSKEAFIILGQNGGYINPQEYFDKGFIPTESDFLEFSPGSNIWLPYWWHLSSNDDCTTDCSFGSHMPSIKLIENQENNSFNPSIPEMINKYVEANLDSCLSDFAQLQYQFDISSNQKPQVTTLISRNDVIVNLDYPLVIDSGNGDGKIERFRVYLPLNFQRIYNMAQNITVAQQEINFLDYHMLTLIDLFSGIDNSKLPPMTGTSFEMGGQVYWVEDTVKNNIREILTSYIPALQVLDSKNYDYTRYDEIQDPMVKSIYNNMVVPLKTPYHLIEADFTYLPNWPIYLKITPNDGGILHSDSWFGLIPIGLQRYRFAYDLVYPVMITLKDSNSFNGEGYTFIFAIESNIRNNAIINTSEVPLEMFKVQSKSSMVCDISKRYSGDIIIKTADSLTQEPLEDVVITFIFGEEACVIGSTNSNGTFRGKFPLGLGVLKLSKTDYGVKQIPFGAIYNEEDSVDEILDKFQTLNVTVLKKTMVKKGRDNWDYGGQVIELDENEVAILLLERQKESIYDVDYTTPIEFTKGSNASIRLLPGRYNLQGQVFLNEDLTIPKDEREEGGFLGLFEQEYTIPKQELTQTISGGIILNDTIPNRAFSISQLDLNKAEITFYLLSFSLKDLLESSREIEDMSQFSNLDEFSGDNRNSLEPSYN